MRQRAFKLNRVVVRLVVVVLIQLSVTAVTLPLPRSDGDGPAKRVLVLLHELALSSTHSLLLQTLAAGGRDGHEDTPEGARVHVDVRAAGAMGVRLHEHGVWQYDALVLLGSELGSELGGEVEVREHTHT